MNIVAMVGNVATEPETKQTSNGRTVCTFRLAVSRIGNQGADFFTIVTWERQAEVCQEYLTIGRRIAVEGRLHHSVWESEDKRRSKVEVIAHRVELLGARPADIETKERSEASVDGEFPKVDLEHELVIT